jgi:hypothetical protein
MSGTVHRRQPARKFYVTRDILSQFVMLPDRFRGPHVPGLCDRDILRQAGPFVSATLRSLLRCGRPAHPWPCVRRMRPHPALARHRRVRARDSNSPFRLRPLVLHVASLCARRSLLWHRPRQRLLRLIELFAHPCARSTTAAQGPPPGFWGKKPSNPLPHPVASSTAQQSLHVHRVASAPT